MKKAISAFCLVGATLSLAACDTTGMGDVDTQPPYAMERTAVTTPKAAPVATPTPVAPAEKVFQRAQTK
ncbi:MAG: hypothetical protein ACRBDI_04255 [Alphaproteobacteria bacterium]